MLLDLRHRLGDCGPRADVAVETLHIETAIAQAGHCRLQAALAHVPSGDAATFGRQPRRDRQPNAARRAGDDADHALQAPRSYHHDTAKAMAFSRNANFWILPLGVRGNSATTSTRSGQYRLATLHSAMYACRAAR